MKNKVTTLIALFIAIAFAILPLHKGVVSEQAVGATSTYTAARLSGQERSEEELEALLAQDPDVQTLISIRDEMTQRVVDNNVSTATLKSAYQAGDEEQIAALLGYSDEEIKTLNYRLDKARVAIFDKFPEVERMVKENPQNPCGYNPKTDSCGTDRFLDHFPTYANNLASPVRCRWIPYIVGLSVCTLAGPIWYWPCAYVALCSFCSGGWVDTACGG